MRLCSLFAGIGGFDLAAEWMGWATAVMVEIEPFPRKVLRKNFHVVAVEQLTAAELRGVIRCWQRWRPGLPTPPTVLYRDVRTFDARPWRDAIDFVTGGFPCQPFSQAGKGLGATDPRALWPQMRRIIRVLQPRLALGENVRGLLTRHPLQFEAVCADLEAAGYDTQPVLFPAAGVDADHERYRFWFVAHARRTGSSQPHAAGITARAGFGARLGNAHNESGPFAVTESALRGPDDGLPAWLVRGSLKAYGNAIVPQVAYRFYRAIDDTLRLHADA